MSGFVANNLRDLWGQVSVSGNKGDRLLYRIVPWPSSPTHCRFQTKSCNCLLLPFFTSKRTLPINTRPYPFDFGIRQRCIDTFSPSFRQGKQCLIVYPLFYYTDSCLMRRPLPIRCTPYNSCSNRVAFDVSNGRKQVFI